jgi:hypothetical protein
MNIDDNSGSTLQLTAADLNEILRNNNVKEIWLNDREYSVVDALQMLKDNNAAAAADRMELHYQIDNNDKIVFDMFWEVDIETKLPVLRVQSRTRWKPEEKLANFIADLRSCKYMPEATIRCLNASGDIVKGKKNIGIGVFFADEAAWTRFVIQHHRDISTRDFVRGVKNGTRPIIVDGIKMRRLWVENGEWNLETEHMGDCLVSDLYVWCEQLLTSFNQSGGVVDDAYVCDY